MRVYINYKVLEVSDTIVILELCHSIGIVLPRYCYHDKLRIAGNCRMCLVEVLNITNSSGVKPVVACSIEIVDGMTILIQSMLVKKAREGVMELLLLNHPLDCPVCDQGGECDLQDQAFVYGNDRGRFYSKKRSILAKNLGFLIKTVMTRCIHCTRCVRFMSDVAGIGTLGMLGRGNSMEIGTYISKILISEISGNVIDLCPVGALTVKPYAFIVRSWELKSLPSIDIFDSMGSNILLQVRNDTLVRILPLRNDSLNENWISDKIRFSFDGLYRQRLLDPLINIYLDYRNVSWKEGMLEYIKQLYRGFYYLQVIIGNDTDLESIFLLKELIFKYGYGSINYDNSSYFSQVDFVCNYRFNNKFISVSLYDGCFFIGGNLRLELPLLLIRMRREQLNRKFIIYSIGSSINYLLNIYHLGTGSNILQKILEGRHKFCMQIFFFKKLLIILGMNSLGFIGNFYVQILKNLANFLLKKGGVYLYINTLYVGANYLGYCDLGLRNKNRIRQRKKQQILYLVGTGDLDINIVKYEYIIYQGHHGNEIVQDANLVLPSYLYFEKNGLFVNIEGRLQESKKILSFLADIRTDVGIISGLFELLEYCKFNFYKEEKNIRSALIRVLGYSLNLINNIIFESIFYKNKGNIFFTSYNKIYNDFYLMDNITNVSEVMANVSFLEKKKKSCIKFHEV